MDIRISIPSLGYVGRIGALCLAKLGYREIGGDMIDIKKISE